MQNITTLLFDIDGTILDTRDFIIKATEHSLSKHGFPIPKRADIAKHVGKAFEEFYFEVSGSKDAASLINEHRNFQYANLHLSLPYPNTIPTLKKLKEAGYKIGAVTTRSKRTSLKTLEGAQVEGFFDTVVSGEDAPAIKPDPAPLFLALEKLGEKPESAVMIGDSYLDIEAGKNAGTKTIRATYGFHTDNLHNPEPDYIVDDIKDLLEILT